MREALERSVRGGMLHIKNTNIKGQSFMRGKHQISVQ
jgi:hypothetical protein